MNNLEILLEEIKKLDKLVDETFIVQLLIIVKNHKNRNIPEWISHSGMFYFLNICVQILLKLFLILEIVVYKFWLNLI